MTAAGYSYLGPPGTFTEAALSQVPLARGKPWRAVNNTGQALDDVVTGVSVAAMLAIENTVEGGVTDVLDALSTIPNLRIYGEYLVPVKFALLAPLTTNLADIQVVTAHPVAYAQCGIWLRGNLPAHTLLTATSNIHAAQSLAGETAGVHAAIAPLSAAARFNLTVIAPMISNNPDAVTRFVLVGKRGAFPQPEMTGYDRTSIVADLPVDQPGALLELLEQFATRGVNLSLIHSRPIGDTLGRYRFVMDLEGHLAQEHVADALLGVKRFSPRVVFLGSYPRGDRGITIMSNTHKKDQNDTYRQARQWLAELRDN